MIQKHRGLVGSIMLVVFLLTSTSAVFSSALSKSALEMLKNLKLDPSILDGMDRELKVPLGI